MLSGGVKPFVTSEVLQGLRLRKHLRRVLRAAEGCHTSAFLRVAFQAWQAGISQDPSDTELRLSAARATRHLLPGLRVACALHLRAFALAASQTRALLRAAKAAYLDELGLIFEGASKEKDTKTLFAALKSLVPSLRGGKGFRCALSVRDEHGLPFPDLERAAAGWSQRFGKPEGGVLVTRESLEDQYIHHAEAQRHLEAPCLEHLPDLLAWEAQFRAIRPGKAPGPDGLGSTPVKLALSEVAFHSYALTLKAAATRCEPLEWRGGQALPLHKGKGAGLAMGEYRSVLRSNLVGKRWHGWLRTVLVPHFLGHRFDLQAGVAGGQSTAALSLHARSFLGTCNTGNEVLLSYLWMSAAPFIPS